MIKKTAKIIKENNRYCVIGHKKQKNGKYKNFGCYDNKKEADDRLSQIFDFQNKKSIILNILTNTSDFLEKKGMIHISDAIIGCAESIALESSNKNIAIRLKKISNLLENKGEMRLSEQLDYLIPEILCFEKCDCYSKLKNKNYIPAEKIYKIAKRLKDKYLVGLINDDSFEYSKMIELEKLLKNGFNLSDPKFYKDIEKKYKNWWEYFSKE